jgi:hypothetical protein
VVGTGGDDLLAQPVADSRIAYRSNSAFGVLRLSLRPTSYDWNFVPIPGQTLTDSGSRSCH